MHVAKLTIEGNSLVGLYVVPMDDVVFVSPGVTDEQKKTIEEIFGAKTVELTIAGTGLLGVFLRTNGKELLVPSLLFAHEEKVLKDSGVSYHIINTKHTCLGNNVVATKKGVLVTPEMEPEAQEQIKQALGVPLKLATLLEATTIGSYMVTTDTHGLASYEFTDDQLDEFESFLGIEFQTGTVNLGATQIHSGIAANNKGFIIGQSSGGPEVVHADEALGFLGDDE